LILAVLSRFTGLLAPSPTGANSSTGDFSASADLRLLAALLALQKIAPLADQLYWRVDTGSSNYSMTLHLSIPCESGDHRARLDTEDLKVAGISTSEEIRKVPLIIWHHGAPTVVARTGGLVDFTPTMCGLLGIDVSRNLFLGKDLLGEADGSVIFRDGSFIGSERSMTAAEALRQLTVSDLVIEKKCFVAH
jgi:hypothetical protein